MSVDETDRERRNKLLELDLTEEEWERVRNIISLLAVRLEFCY